jgi:PadR family transcriptional regulator, regulatory protein PadR
MKGNLNIIILPSLADGDKYGYEITKKINILTNAAIQLKEGSLYPALHKLEKQGLIEGYWVQQEPGKPDRKYYKLTSEGIKNIDQEKENWKSFLNIMGRVIYGEEHT